MIAAKVGSIRVVGQEMLQEGSEVVSMPQCQVGTEHVLVHQAQVEVVAEGVHVHQVTDLVTLLREQHGQLRRNSRGGLRVGDTGRPIHPGQRGSSAALLVAVETPSAARVYGEPSPSTW